MPLKAFVQSINQFALGQNHHDFEFYFKINKILMSHCQQLKQRNFSLFSNPSINMSVLELVGQRQMRLSKYDGDNEDGFLL